MNPTAPSGPAGPPKGQEYPLDHHFGNKSSLIRELWEALDDLAESLGGDVTRRVRKQYIGYYRGKKSFFTAEIQKARVLIYLALTSETAMPWNDSVMRDVSQIGHFGMVMSSTPSSPSSSYPRHRHSSSAPTATDRRDHTSEQPIYGIAHAGTSRSACRHSHAATTSCPSSVSQASADAHWRP